MIKSTTYSIKVSKFVCFFHAINAPKSNLYNFQIHFMNDKKGENNLLKNSSRPFPDKVSTKIKFYFFYQKAHPLKPNRIMVG